MSRTTRRATRGAALVATSLVALSLGSAPATAEEGGSLTRRAHQFTNTWFDHVADGDWSWVRKRTNTGNIPMKDVKELEGAERDVEGCSRRSDFGRYPTRPRLRYCFDGTAEWQVVRLDSGRLRMKDVNWYG